MKKTKILTHYYNSYAQQQMSYHSKIEKLVDTALGDMQPGLMAKVSENL